MRFITYMGTSMNPTFNDFDKLRVAPYDDRHKIKKGDVIVFRIPEGKHPVVHRVISVNWQGIRTKGDNNNQVDSKILYPDQIIGRVVCKQTGCRRKIVFGGRMGQLCAVTMRAIRRLDSGISFLLRPIYHLFVHSGIFRRSMPGLFRTRIFYFIRQEGIEFQLILGKRVVGRLRPWRSRWHIKRPFRLFVDETSLPRGEPIHPDPPEKSAL